VGLKNEKGAGENFVKGESDHFYQHIWKEATTFERVVLSAIAEELTHTQAEHMGVEFIYDKIRGVSSAYTRKQLMETLEKLVTREILWEKNMLYGFPVHLLRKWTAAKYPLRKVREEI
jgi:hypothetical protein